MDKLIIVGQISTHQWGRVFDPKGIIGGLTACDYKSPPLVQIETNEQKSDIMQSTHKRK